jgi:hypothetical protein
MKRKKKEGREEAEWIGRRRRGEEGEEKEEAGCSTSQLRVFNII